MEIMKLYFKANLKICSCVVTETGKFDSNHHKYANRLMLSFTYCYQMCSGPKCSHLAEPTVL